MLNKEQSAMAERCTPFYEEQQEQYTLSEYVKYWWVAEIMIAEGNQTIDELHIIYPARTINEACKIADNRIQEITEQDVFGNVRPATVSEMLEYLGEIQERLNGDPDPLPF